jgi:hypothetical protein
MSVAIGIAQPPSESPSRFTATSSGQGVVQMPQDEREIVEPAAQRRFDRCRRLSRERAAGQVRRVDTD